MQVTLVSADGEWTERALWHLTIAGMRCQTLQPEEILRGNVRIIPQSVLVVDIRPEAPYGSETIRTLRGHIGPAPGILALTDRSRHQGALEAGADQYLDSHHANTVVLSAALASLHRLVKRSSIADVS